ncbi:PAS domain S-box-containing protein [Nannocystis exedens]|uniref:PAS domain S-box-containing protein n=1 Tax=Nannocystis exedens TaxID=54 RepID=A0A1I2FG73_9BACT|nr:histidine kinase dimerization/phosphoacceptor domain -containing protein [Nannocystis exedens]PCC70431.1 signal transduction histidine kinase [Nannocystis exedens]SFF04412.1 PAS domain S-box-containing protein [Nannocystis exedens]
MSPTPEVSLQILQQLAGALAAVPRVSQSSAPRDAILAHAEARYLVEQIPAVTFMASLEGGLSEVYVSPQIEALLGFSQEEWSTNPVLWFRQLHPGDRDLWNAEFARGCATDGQFRADCRFLARDGRVVWVHGEARLVNDERGRPLFLQGVAFDISEIKRAEEAVRASLREKELLLKELHHRVKNNLQITASLLRLQSDKVDDEAARQLLKESRDRIRSMSLVHEMLYRSKDFARVDFADYTRSLVAQLFQSYGGSACHIAVKTELDSIEVGIDVAVPCGLIINELVSNSLKYAFRDRDCGEIHVRLRALSGSRAELMIRDDGVGMAAEGRIQGAQTLGLTLVRTLVAQLEGTLGLLVQDGTETTITFPLPVRGDGGDER